MHLILSPIYQLVMIVLCTLVMWCQTFWVHFVSISSIALKLDTPRCDHVRRLSSGAPQTHPVTTWLIQNHPMTLISTLYILYSRCLVPKIPCIAYTDTFFVCVYVSRSHMGGATIIVVYKLSNHRCWLKPSLTQYGWSLSQMLNLNFVSWMW